MQCEPRCTQLYMEIKPKMPAVRLVDVYWPPQKQRLHRCPKPDAIHHRYESCMAMGFHQRGSSYGSITMGCRLFVQFIAIFTSVKHVLSTWKVTVECENILLVQYELHSHYSHFVDGFSQVGQGFMRINAFCHTGPGMSKYHLYRGLVSTWPI